MLKSVYLQSDCFKSDLVPSSVACHGMFSSVWLGYLQVRLFQHVAILQVFSDPSGVFQGKRGGSSVSGSSPGRGFLLSSWEIHVFLTVLLFTQV